jgi:cytochrome b561
MKQSVFSKYLLPFFQWYALMILIAIVIDYFLHRLQLLSVGRYLGYVGTIIVIISFVYSLRKRKLIKSGSPKKLLELHEYLAWIGSILIIVHAGIHFNAILPWLALLMLLIAVATGLIGKFLLQKANDNLKDKKQDLIVKGLSKEEAGSQLFLDSVTVDLMKKWRTVHLPITLILGILVLLHIITIVMYSK